MRVTVRAASRPASIRTPALCALVDPGAAGGPVLGLGRTGSDRVDGAVADAVRRAREGRRAKRGHTAAIDTMGMAAPRLIILAWAAGAGRRRGGGGGAEAGIGGDAVRHAAGAAARAAADAGCGSLAVVAPPGADAAPSAAQIVEGATLSLYSFDRYRAAGARPAPRSLAVVVRGAGEARSARTGRAVAQAVAGSEGSILARDTANLPPNECPPAGMARAARAACASSPALRCRVMSGAALARGGFGGILAVGGGSANGPRLIAVEYAGAPGGGARGGRRLRRPVALVGKAVTFDTGGISLKPRDKMDEMKFDKCGGCAVLGAVSAAAAMRLPIDVVGIIPSAENMPGGESYRPGDIVRLRGGRTAEIINTDAEGRLMLADAISYAESEYAPREIVDLATLTGACVVALGNNTAGLFSNDDGLAGRLLEASARTSEAVWRMPLGDEHADMIRSRVADVKNMGTGRAAGAAAAAAFLRAAVGATPWAHIDIAGTAWTQPGTAARPYNPRGATGFGVRLILDYLAGLCGPGGGGGSAGGRGRGQ